MIMSHPCTCPPGVWGIRNVSILSLFWLHGIMERNVAAYYTLFLIHFFAIPTRKMILKYFSPALGLTECAAIRIPFFAMRDFNFSSVHHSTYESVHWRELHTPHGPPISLQWNLLFAI
jgi:hypothetical protein